MITDTIATPASDLMGVRWRFVQFVRNFRDSHGLSWCELAKIAGVDRITLVNVIGDLPEPPKTGFNITTMETVVSNIITWEAERGEPSATA